MKKLIIIPIIITAVMLIINVTARLWQGFADFYVTKIFPVLNNLSAVCGVFRFSFGELLIKLGLVLVVAGIPAGIFLFIIKKNSRLRIIGVYSAVCLWILAYISTTETLNCFIMYQCKPFSQVYFQESERSREQLVGLYGYLIENGNRLAEEVERDSEGNFRISCNLENSAREIMKKASEKYPQLRGYNPRPKPISSSFVMSQMSLLGIYFPFTLEANYNPEVYESNIPNTVCHELTHLKGIIREDEAGFFAFVVSTESDNTDFQYSGYLNALEYVNNEIYRNRITEAYPLSYEISDKLSKDMYAFVPEDYWKENQEKEVISTETVNIISDKAVDTNLKVNGVSDGIQSYSRIVNLLIDYYVQKSGL